MNLNVQVNEKIRKKIKLLFNNFNHSRLPLQLQVPRIISNQSGAATNNLHENKSTPYNFVKNLISKPPVTPPKVSI